MKHKDVDKVKCTFLHVRLTNEEHQIIKMFAKEHGISVSTLIKYALNKIGVEIRF